MTTTTTHINEQSALRALELICQGDTGPAVEDVIHPSAVNHRGPHDEPGGPEEFRKIIGWLGAAFADITITPQDVISSGDKVVARVRFKGLHVGPFQGIPATNRTIEIDEIHIWRLQDGLIIEHWACMDELAGLRRMGAEIAPTR